ncbi:MAG: hypothetical protein FD145_700 [Candidatus Saganbacteria bacterium]|uniref:YgiT-type zinc finger protein n=1 Tax=Candidatus Saganbacteria bacterium TaxID=2575572 RepID=A0A833P388_UNCSA|nr:MAG: hypothetical protein FD145_700 [Candidatus Saganbacteria bacterium]
MGNSIIIVVLVKLEICGYNNSALKNNKENNSSNVENTFEEAEQTCEACGGKLKPEKINLEEFENGKLYLMENTVAYICGDCGETWIPEPILKEFEKMIDTAKNRK